MAARCHIKKFTLFCISAPMFFSISLGQSGAKDTDDLKTVLGCIERTPQNYMVVDSHGVSYLLDGVGNQMALPYHAWLLGILEPPQPVGHPTHRDDIWSSIVIYIHRPLAAIGHKFTDDLDRAVSMTLSPPCGPGFSYHQAPLTRSGRPSPFTSMVVMPSAWSALNRCTKKVDCGTLPGALPRTSFSCARPRVNQSATAPVIHDDLTSSQHRAVIIAIVYEFHACSEPHC